MVEGFLQLPCPLNCVEEKMKQRLFFASVLLLAFFGVALGCGDDEDAEHPYQNECETRCSYDGKADCHDLADDCLETCLVETEELEGNCGLCVTDQFDVVGSCSGSDEEMLCACDQRSGNIFDCGDFCS